MGICPSRAKSAARVKDEHVKHVGGACAQGSCGTEEAKAAGDVAGRGPDADDEQNSMRAEESQQNCPGSAKAEGTALPRRSVAFSEYPEHCEQESDGQLDELQDDDSAGSLVQRKRCRAMTTTSEGAMSASDEEFGLSDQQMDDLMFTGSRERSLTRTSFGGISAADSDFGLSDGQLKELMQEMNFGLESGARSSLTRTSLGGISAADSDFGLSDGQLEELMQGLTSSKPSEESGTDGTQEVQPLPSESIEGEAPGGNDVFGGLHEAVEAALRLEPAEREVAVPMAVQMLLSKSRNKGEDARSLLRTLDSTCSRLAAAAGDAPALLDRLRKALQDVAASENLEDQQPAPQEASNSDAGSNTAANAEDTDDNEGTPFVLGQVKLPLATMLNIANGIEPDDLNAAAASCKSLCIAININLQYMLFLIRLMRLIVLGPELARQLNETVDFSSESDTESTVASSNS